MFFEVAMMRMRWSLSLLALLSTAVFGPGLRADVAQDSFAEGVELLQRGKKEDALKAFQAALAADPSNQAAYELWIHTDHQVWLALLMEGGEFELVGKRFMDLAAMGRMARENDADAIRALVKQAQSEDVGVRTRAVRELASAHGEYAVPMLLYGLGNPDDLDARVLSMQALTRMGPDVVAPLIEALDSQDAFLRRNVALTLGYIADPRAAPRLANLASMDADAGVKTAASEALSRCGGSPDALAGYLAQGDAYHNEHASVLAPGLSSDVTWSSDGTMLASSEVPRFLYHEEMAKKAYRRALGVAPSSTEALAGLARVTVAERELLNEWEAAGQDVAEWKGKLARDELTVGLVGADALDVALGWALAQNDQSAASGLCRALGTSSTQATPNLVKALSMNKSGAVRGEAAVALGAIAHRTWAATSGEVIHALAEAAGREVLRIAIVIGSDENGRTDGVASALESAGLHVNHWPTGARGLTGMRTVPGVDLFVVSESLPDLTLSQVVADIRSEPRFSATPIFVATGNGESVAELYGDRISGTLTSGEEAGKAIDALASTLNRDREEAAALASRAASTLAALAASGHTDVSGAASALVATLDRGADGVVVPALATLGHVGGTAHQGPIAAVLSSSERSREARLAAANALGGIFARTGSADAGAVEALFLAASTDDDLEIGAAAATALSHSNLSADQRAKLLAGLRGGVSTSAK